MPLPSSVDVAIIGAGAAGLGAAHALKDSGLSSIVLEARDRAGGRGHTVMATPEITFDLGCGWLHSADQNSFVGIAEQFGLKSTRRFRPGASAPGATRFRRQSEATSSDRWTNSSSASTTPRRAAATAPPVFISGPAIAGTR